MEVHRNVLKNRAVRTRRASGSTNFPFRTSRSFLSRSTQISFRLCRNQETITYCPSFLRIPMTSSLSHLHLAWFPSRPDPVPTFPRYRFHSVTPRRAVARPETTIPTDSCPIHAHAVTTCSAFPYMHHVCPERSRGSRGWIPRSIASLTGRACRAATPNAPPGPVSTRTFGR